MDRTATGSADRARGFSARVLHPTPAVTAAAAVAAAFLWMGVLAGEAARTGLAGSLRSRPDRLLGWDGAAFWAPLTIATALAAVLVVVAALGLRIAIRGRTTWLATMALLAAAGLGELAIQVFTPDANMYETNPLRGLGAWLLVLAAPAAVALAGVGLVRTGSTVAGWASLAASLVMVWVAVDLAAVGATSGAVQPQTEASIGVEVVLAAWLVAMSILVLALRGRASVTGIASLRGKLALGGVGAVTTVLFGAQMIAAVVGYSYLGPTVLAQVAGRTQAATIEVDGITRSYRIHRAPSLDPNPGLVISLSGVFGDGFQSEFNSGFDEEVDRVGWIAIYPDSVLDGWMAYGSDDTWGHHPGADDVPFLRALIDREIAGDGVDPGRVFVSGMSRGGMMTHRAGCELADVVAAIAPVSGNMATASGSAADVPCHPVRPISVLAMHGTGDSVIPFEGGRVDINFSPFREVMAKWRALNGCTGDGSTAVDGASTTTSWTCAGGTTTAMRVIAGGSHVWPGSWSQSGPDGFDAARVIVDFFAAHARR
jgi:polyhydroxybutyrate depolymerase